MADYDELNALLAQMGGVVIGYSGGVDSALLAKAATDVLGKNAVCVLVESSLVPEVEIEDAISTAEALGLNLVRLNVDALSMPHVSENAPDRCYHCKKSVFSAIAEIARQRGLSFILDGSNANDESDYRPGSLAASELGVRSPFRELGFSKEQIRAVSRELGLVTWNKPSFACLATRVPYGTTITAEILKRVEGAEDVMRQLGFHQFRVRHHDDVARIELMPVEMERIMAPTMRAAVLGELKSLGYAYVSLDLAGYRSGSMNETLDIAF